MPNEQHALNCNSAACGCNSSEINRRDFLRWAGLAAGAGMAWPSIAGPFTNDDFKNLVPADKKLDPAWLKSLYARGEPAIHRGKELATIGMPVGGICAGQLYLGGDGRLWHWDIFNLPQLSNFSDTSGPNYARPPKPDSPIDQGFGIKITQSGESWVRTLDSRGFEPRFISFRGEYPVGLVAYQDPALPVTVSLHAFSPFIPLNVAESSLPATVMRFKVKNVSSTSVEVELGGWLQNAVCLDSGRGGFGARRNAIVRGPGVTMVHSTAAARKEQDRPKPRPEILFENFELGYGKWTKSGEAFGDAPAAGTLPGQNRVSGFSGNHLVNTFLRGDSTKGRLLSGEFKIDRRCIAFLIGGGAHVGRTCMNLLVEGNVVRTATGVNNEKLEWKEWDTAELEGKTARIEIVDEATEGWGHINIDQILFTDSPPSSRVPLETREDFGSMCLAILGEPNGVRSRTRIPVNAGESMFADVVQDEAVEDFDRSLVGSISRRLSLEPGMEQEVAFVIAWFFPGLLRSTLGPLEEVDRLHRSYANRFKSAADVARYVAANFERLSDQTELWRKTWYDSTLPYWFLDRTFAPICTLATNTCYQFNTGRFYAFEGVYCCQGTCQHVWNYAQSVARIFPELERDLRQRTDFGTSWHEDGATDYRGECARHVAHDGQCGVILRAWREHQMASDSSYLRASWPRIRKSIEFLIGVDADENGLIEGEQYNTLDASWFGPMAWISSFYVAALRAGEAMAKEVGDAQFEQRCRAIAERGSENLVQHLYNGEYFIHKPDPARPKATNTNNGCHIDQLMGQAWAFQVGLPRVVPVNETRSALKSIWTYNFTPDVGPFREKTPIKGGRWYAMAGEGGVVMTTFPKGGVEQAAGEGGFGYYFNEVWTGQEHQLAAHMLWEGMTDEALVITRVLHDRHHPSRRNPYNEVECSDHYARAMSSHGTFLAACGFECNGPAGYFAFAPRLRPEDFKAPFTAAEGWGTFQQKRKNGSQSEALTVCYGRLKLQSVAFETAPDLQVSKTQVSANGERVEATMQQSGQRVLLRFSEPVVLNEGGSLNVVLS